MIPAYNEEARLESMLEEAVAYLDATYGRSSKPSSSYDASSTSASKPSDTTRNRNPAQKTVTSDKSRGYEILIVNDGSTDKTVDVALKFSHKHSLHSILRVVTLEENRGKGGAVTHGLRHARGEYAIFADADGASHFPDIAKLIKGADSVADSAGRAVAVGSRAWMVGSEAVVQRSALRNALMHGFHLFLRLMTPRETSKIGDTQCGFKLFTRAALPYIVPFMHAESWIFDVEMLMLAESAGHAGGSVEESERLANGKKGLARSVSGIPVAEIPIGWKEVGGSKLNVLWDSLGMAWGLAVLRGAWLFGVYRRR